MELVPYLAQRFKHLEGTLEGAKLKYNAEEWIRRALNFGAFACVLTTIMCFFMFMSLGWSLLWLVPVIAGSYALGFFFIMNAPSVYAKKEEDKIDQNLIFAAQYLLIKMNSGEPLFSSLIGVSKSYGETGKAFCDIVQDVHFGSSIEDAVDRMVKITPSKNFKRILWEISNTMKTGADVRRSLESILKQLHDEFIIKIEAYGKKLNTITMLYMVVAIIVPSLGMTLFVIIASFIQIELPNPVLYFVAFLLGVLQFFFISIFKTIRPAVEL